MPDDEDGAERGLPLQGIRVLAAEQMIALPFMTQLLGLLGAEVIKVEPPTGDPGRVSIPLWTAPDGAKHGSTFSRANSNKSSLVLDLKQPAGRDVFLRLAAQVDVVCENMRPGVMDRLGLGYEDVAAVAPRAVYLSVSGFGNRGDSPYRDWPAYAPVVEAMSGLYEMGREDGVRLKTNIAGALGDVGTAVFAGFGLLAALRRRDRTGLGEYVDIAMLDSMIAINDMYPQMWSLGTTVNGRRAGVMGSFKAADGDFVMAALREHQLERLARLVGHEEWLGHPELPTRRDWYLHLDDLIRPAIEEWAAGLSKVEASRQLAERGIAAGPSFTPADLDADPHVQSHQMFVSYEGVEQTMRIAGNPMKFVHGPRPEHRRFPDLGADTDALLRELLGLDDEELTSLRVSGVTQERL